MPLLDRADSTLVVVDAQRVFYDQRSMTAEEREAGAATLEPGGVALHYGRRR
jgi:hypothetical protein